MAVVTLPTDEIRDRASFHSVCQRTLGFPDFYGRNMDAWIDCLTDLDECEGMTTFTLAPDERLIIELPAALALQNRAPDVFAALLDCTAFVNQRHIDAGKSPLIALVLC